MELVSVLKYFNVKNFTIVNLVIFSLFPSLFPSYLILWSKMQVPSQTLNIKRTNDYFDINEADILLIIKILYTSKPHVSNKISIRMIQICGKVIAIPLKIIF